MGELDDEDRVLESVKRLKEETKLATGREASASSLLEEFGFTGDKLVARIGDLSGGERRRLQFLRLLLTEPNVLILDEPTAALDARSEFEVFQRFKELSEGKTAVLISHRFSSVRMADRILVLADGTVEAQGSHEELLAGGGRYAELFELQAAGYR